MTRLVVNLFAVFAAVSGLSMAVRQMHRRRFGPRVFVLEYHGVSSDKCEREGTISQDRFRRHLSYFMRSYRVISRPEATRFLQGEAPSAQDMIVVTFDDGYRNNYTSAWPVLMQHGIPATIFLTTGYLDGVPLWFDVARRSLESGVALGDVLPPRLATSLSANGENLQHSSSIERTLDQLKSLSETDRSSVVDALAKATLRPIEETPPLTWSQVSEMQQAGIEMGGHTVTHPILSTLSREHQEEEILGCWARILEATGVPPSVFAYPNGSAEDFDQLTMSVLRSSGFSTAMTTIRGPNRPGCDPYALRRIGIGSDSTWLLSARLSGLFDEEVRQRFRKTRRR